MLNDFRRTVKDKQTGQNVVLSDKDVELIERIQSGHIPDAGFEEFAVCLYYICFDWWSNLN